MIFSKRPSSLRTRSRRTSFELLESRQLLSITFDGIANQTVAAGAPLNVALHASETDGHAIEYTVSVNNSTTNNPQLTAAVPHGNNSLKITVSDTVNNISGDLVFQLCNDLAPEAVEQIINLVNNTSIRNGTPFYNGLIFHRIVKDFMVQGGGSNGNGSVNPGFRFDDQYNSQLQFTSAGVLALAKPTNKDEITPSSDTNGSQFFITTDPFRYGDFRYTIIGFLTDGADILTKIENVPVENNQSDPPEKSSPVDPVTIVSAVTFVDTQNGVLRLSAPNGKTGTASVTVTAKDTVTNEEVTKTFQVTVAVDTSNAPPYLNEVDPIETTMNEEVSFYLTGTDVEGDPIYYSAGVIVDGEVVDHSDQLSVTVDHATGKVTVTPAEGVTGVFGINVSVRRQNPLGGNNDNSWDSQMVPLYIHPGAPATISLLSNSDTGSSNSDKITQLNNTDSHTLQFRVEGVLVGAEVQLYLGNQLIGTANATTTSVVITTDNVHAFAEGVNTLTAKQVLKNQAVEVGNLDTTVDLSSEATGALTVTVDTTAPQFNFTPATLAGVGLLYRCRAKAVASPAGATTFSLTEKPNGMTIDPNTGWISWTPATGLSGDHAVTVRATDAAGNTSDKEFTITIKPASELPPEITILHGTTFLEDGQTTPINLGTVKKDDAGPTITLTIRNDGGQTLTLTKPFADTAHFTVGEPVKSTLASGESTTFTITLKTDVLWTGSEEISLQSTDGDMDTLVESPFTFTVSGTVNDPLKKDFSTVGLFNPYDSIFYLKNGNSRGVADVTFDYGCADSGIVTDAGRWTGWVSVVGDWNGDGVDNVGLYNPKTSTFYLRNSNNRGYADLTFTYGLPGAGWMPIAGDWDGDGVDTVGLYNPATSVFYLRNKNTTGIADTTFVYGPSGAGWMPLVGDWNAQGRDTVGLYNPATSVFYLRNSNTTGIADTTFLYGPSGAGWLPIAGDWNVDGTDTVGMYDPIQSKFYLRDSNTTGIADASFNYGPFDPGWTPIVGDWNGVQAMKAAGGANLAHVETASLDRDDLQPLVAEAIGRWEDAGLDASLVAKLKQVDFVVTDLAGDSLGEARGDRVLIDVDAAGHGWFVDSTPSRDEEFAPAAGGTLHAIDARTLDRIDLLSVIEHELGHIAGLDDLDALAQDVMQSELEVGVRLNP